MSTSTDLHTSITDPFEKYYYAISDGGEEEEEDLHDYYGYEGPIKYRTEDFISRPRCSRHSDIEDNILEFDCSYGYDCKKPYNLVVIDENTIIFASGNLIHFLDVSTSEIWYRRSCKGSGIGHITNNPVLPHFAVGENGQNPPIIVYEWPAMEIICVLKGGTGSSKHHTHLNYSPDGDLLVSQGGEPDYLITVWDWAKAVILLRTKSYVNDVLRVMFSPSVPGQLTSSGVAHIKFWKIAQTFTGLKLQGNLGRFGKTEFSDIVGIYPMADEKVISGCYWGNILVWEEGLIKFEVCRKGRKRCHDDSIVQFNYHHGELWTVSLDGHVKMWYYDTIDQADPPDEDRFCMMEPTYDFHTPGARFMSIAKQFKDPENTFYFAQDAKGAIWKIDLNIEEEAAPSVRLLKSHAGITKGLAICPWGPYFTTIGIGGWVHLYNYMTRKLILIILYPAPGMQIMWMPMEYDPSGEVVIMGFGDGTIRVAVWKIDEAASSQIHVIQLIKPHTKAINVISLNPTGNLFVTGSDDMSVFVFQVQYELRKYPVLVPIGYIPIGDVPSCFTWHNNEPNTLIAGCFRGTIYIMQLPTVPQPYTRISYELVTVPITQKFHSYKSQIFRDIAAKKLAEKKAIKREKQLELLRKVRADNPGLDIDEEQFLQDSEEDEPLPELYIPEVPNQIYWIMHTANDTLWVSMAGYDAGYIYEYKVGQSNPVPFKFQAIPGIEEHAIANYIYSHNQEYLLFAMSDGSIRVNRVNRADWHDLTNYWSLSMHDNYNGYIPGFKFSYDHEYFMTSGNDGNVFVFKYNSDEPKFEVKVPERIIPDFTRYKLYDNVDSSGMPSLEENIVNSEVERLNKVANANKQTYIAQILKLREEYEAVLEANETLPESQKMTDEQLVVDQRVEDYLKKALADEEALIRRKFDFNLEKSRLKLEKLKTHFIDSMDVFPIHVCSIRTNKIIRTIKQHCLGDDFYKLLDMTEWKMVEADTKGRAPIRNAPTAPRAITPIKPETKLEYFLIGIDPYIIEHKFGPKMHRLLRKYREKKEWKENRKQEWDRFNSLKPQEGTIEEDELMLAQAEESIGDYKLKSAPDYKVSKLYRETTFKKYKQLLLCREKSYNLIHDINMKVYEMREEKKNLYDLLLSHTEKLRRIQDQLLPIHHKPAPTMFEIQDDEYPEEFLEIRVEYQPFKNKRPSVEEPPAIVELTPDDLQQTVLVEMVSDKKENNTDSEWERDFRRIRYRNKCYAQDRVMLIMNTSIDHYDMIHERIHDEILRAHVEADSMHLHLLVLHQEMLILQDCEAKEDHLSDRVNGKLQELMDLQDENTSIVFEIEGLKKEMDILLEQEKDINKSFYSTVADNKFYDFLRRIFKKKYKPPKIPNPDDDSESSSSSSSSSESEEEDAASIDSKDFGIIRLDENVCPKGCDVAIYNLTFELRNQRHEKEQQYRECTTESEKKLKLKEALGKRIRIVEADLKKRRDELETFQREKQGKLNQIICTVILKLSQMKHIKDEGGLNLINKTLVFSQQALTGLYKRVGMLKMEEQEQTDKHSSCINHLRRMVIDLRAMANDIKKLKGQIVDQMNIKFGSVVNIQELEEYLLKRLIFDLRISLSDVKGMFDAQMALLYEDYKKEQTAILRLLRQNTYAQDLLCMLNMERAELNDMQDHQLKVQTTIQKIYSQAEKVNKEMKKLSVVIKGQNAEIEELKKEIKIYKTKGLAIPPPKIPEPVELSDEEVQEEQSFVSEWCDIDDYMYTESYAKEYWANVAIQEARKTKRDVIFYIMNELFQNISIQIQRNNIVALMKTVVSDVMNNCDVREILEDILKVIPTGHLTDEQNSLIELTAERLYSVQTIDEEETEEEENEESKLQIREQAIEKINQIADQVFSDTEGDPAIVITTLVEKLLDQVPLNVIMEESCMEIVLSRLAHSVPHLQHIDKEILDTIELKSLEANILIDECLRRVCEQFEKSASLEPSYRDTNEVD